MGERMIYCFDLDGTLCTQRDGDYSNAEPYMDRIQKVNSLYDSGHTIYIETARGTESGVDWNEATKNQLREWGVKYHKLRAGIKFAATYYIDDRAVHVDNFFDKEYKETYRRP